MLFKSNWCFMIGLNFRDLPFSNTTCVTSYIQWDHWTILIFGQQVSKYGDCGKISNDGKVNNNAQISFSSSS